MPRKLLTDTFCRTVKPRVAGGIAMDAKYSDSGGLYLLVTANGAKLWRMAYRFHGRQKKLAIGRYGNGDDGTVSLVMARQKRDAAKALLAQDRRLIPRSRSNSRSTVSGPRALSVTGSMTGSRKRGPRRSSAASW